MKKLNSIIQQALDTLDYTKYKVKDKHNRFRNINKLERTIDGSLACIVGKQEYWVNELTIERIKIK